MVPFIVDLRRSGLCRGLEASRARFGVFQEGRSMAYLFRQKIIRYLDAHGKRVRSDSPGARRVVEYARKWYGEYTDAHGIKRREPLSINKVASQQMLADRVKRSEHEKAGIVSPFETHHHRLLSQHVADFEETLNAKGDDAGYCRQTAFRLRQIIEGCGFRQISDISASQVEVYLGKLKREGSSQQTVNHDLTVAKQFTRWLVTDRRTADNRLAHLKKAKVTTDDQIIERRELNDEELSWLLTCTEAGPVRSKLTGHQRFILYLVAMETGLRGRELASLTPASFDFESDPPTVKIAAKDEKARHGAELPLSTQLVAVVRPWIEGCPPGQPLWPGKWAQHKAASKFIRRDLEFARAAWTSDARTETDRKLREESGLLMYVNRDGLQADFHALRHTFLSRLNRSGASAKAMQTLARHSTPELTLNRYTHANLYDLAAAVNSMNPLPLNRPDPEQQRQSLRAMGTDGRSLVSSLLN